MAKLGKFHALESVGRKSGDGVKKIHLKQCYLCGAVENLTRDHIPPESFFISPRPSNLITVPCCRSCNASYAKDDEATRAWFSSHLGASRAGNWILQNKVIPGVIKHSPAFRNTMLASMKDIRIHTEDGDIEAIRLTIPFARVERFIIRITKGLLTHYFPDYNYSKDWFRVAHIPSRTDALEKIQPIRDSLEYDERGHGIFQFRRGLMPSKQSGVWLLLFYESVSFLVQHSKTDPPNPIEIAKDRQNPDIKSPLS